jgi:hypothetical protein
VLPFGRSSNGEHEEERNPRLQNLDQLANWFPKNRQAGADTESGRGAGRRGAAKETQVPAGMLVVARSTAHKWKANGTFLQAIGDPMMMSVSHTAALAGAPHGVCDDRTGWIAVRTSGVC